MNALNEDLIYWVGALRRCKTGIPYVQAIPRPLYEYPIDSGGYGKVIHAKTAVD